MVKYSKLASVWVLLMLAPYLSQAQHGRHASNERIEVALIAHITQQLKFTPTEAERFWPVYNQFKDKRRQIKKQQHLILEDLKKSAGDEAQASTLLAQYFTLERQENDLDELYYGTKFKDQLGSIRVLTLMQAEKDFRRLLLERLKDRRPGGNLRPSQD